MIQNYKVITLCGSTRFKDQFIETQKRLTLEGCIVFDCMNLYARLGDDGTVELSGTVFYWNPVDGDTQKSVTIQTFPNLEACLEWLGNESAARDKCVELLNENC